MTDRAETIRYTADVVCLRGDDVLLIERGWDPHKGLLALPGGHVDEGETAQSAAVRELWEETGVRVREEDLTLIGVYDQPDRDPRGRYVSAAYLVTVPEGTRAQAGDDAAAVQWKPLANPGPLAFDHSTIVHTAWRAARQASPAETEAGPASGRCEAAHPSDPSKCGGPLAVIVVDRLGVRVDGCEHHAARMLASLTHAHAFPLPGASEGAATRTMAAAAGLPPYVWRRPLQR
ncbi:NUDIX domain-containing protein [Streptomyces sp. NPDC002886]|uniref:NUDIX domain-containing protein n=1 Tax=Streptomyces sp. NPDC002886 TaxID=3364667 RepID=UPI00367CB943